MQRRLASCDQLLLLRKWDVRSEVWAEKISVHSLVWSASLLGVLATQTGFTGPLNWEGVPGKSEAYSERQQSSFLPGTFVAVTIAQALWMASFCSVLCYGDLILYPKMEIHPPNPRSFHSDQVSFNKDGTCSLVASESWCPDLGGLPLWPF